MSFPFALAAASLTFGSACDGDDAPSQDGGNDADGGTTGTTTGTTGTSTGDGGSTGGGSTAEDSLLAFSSTVCGRYEECDPQGVADQWGSQEDCEEDLSGDYLLYFSDVSLEAADPAGCDAAIASYFDCLAETYTELSCSELLNEDFDEDCAAEDRALYRACALP